jgi:hypothetical protein
MPSTRDSALEALVPVERMLRRAEPAAVDDLLELRARLEAIAGRTVTRGRAARFLGLTQTSIDRWIDDGAVPTVPERTGRTMVPTRELVRLRVEMDAERVAGSQRPLSRVVRRRRAAAAEIAMADLVPKPMTSPSGHRRAEVGDLLIHRLIERGLTPLDIAIARWQLDRALEAGDLHPQWHAAWREVLDGGEKRVRTVLSEDSAEAASLRQTSPFKGRLGHEERRRAFAVLKELTTA